MGTNGLKDAMDAKRNCRESWEIFFATFIQKVTEIKCHENSRIKMSREFKVGLSLSKKKIICFNNSPSKMMKNSFYFILKALFVLKIFKILSRPFGHVEKTAWLER